MDAPPLECRTAEIGHEIFARARRAGAGLPLDRWAMEWGMRDEQIKTQLLRFMDVLPALTTPPQINAHLRQYLQCVRDRLPFPAAWAIARLPDDGILARWAAALARRSAEWMAQQFIAATNLDQAIAAVRDLRREKLAFTIDLLGEAVLSEAEAEQYADQYQHLIEGLAADERNWPVVKTIDHDPLGKLPRINVSVKLSSLFSQFDPIDPAATSLAVRARLRPLLRQAQKRGVFVNIDMEHYAHKDATLRIFRDVLEEAEFAQWPDMGIAIQTYLRDSADDLAALAKWAKARGTPVWVRLVKGAYWDYETAMARQNDWPVPVYSLKAQSDANFEARTTFLMEHADVLRPAIASHNIRSLAHALATAQRLRQPRGSFEVQMLYGMGRQIQKALVEMGHRVRVYTPYGQLLPGMAYFVRRLLENTSNQSFLRAGFAQHQPEEQLLMNPLEILRRKPPVPALVPPSAPPVSPAPPSLPVEPGRPRPGSASSSPETFVNEPLTDFAQESARRAMEDALRSVAAQLGRDYPLVVGGQNLQSGAWIESVNPSHARQLVGRAAHATAQQAQAAVAAAQAAYASWRNTPAQHRCGLLFQSARVLRRRRFELAAWEVHETGKPWREADADVAEAIDYCEYYGRQMLRLAKPQRRDVPGEQNQYIYESRGVAAVIAPWNFPLAILCGMTTAALAAGNTAIMKPAEQSPVVAAKLMEVFQEAGFPPGVVNLLSGIGEEVGPVLVNHPRVAIIAFTGSRAVGLAIQESAAKMLPQQHLLKRVITEMGGKNAIIVDQDADLDQAVQGVAASAFGYAGQKCSACSRAIVLPEIYDVFLQRLVEATRSLHVAPAEEAACYVGPVIDAEARTRILDCIARGQSQGHLVYAGDLGNLAQEGFYVGPHLFADVAPETPLAQEEIFGPVLAVIPAKNLDDALAIANTTRYALTGGLYSRSPAAIERIRREFHVGNLYINRKITGALVDRQPFGGFKLSGIGSKAGGPDYLLQFLQGRTITENTLRHGFVPTLTP